MTDKVTIGKNIKTAREESGLTQKVVSEQSDISISQLSSYENGKQMPGLPTLGKLATALGTSLDRLYYGNPSEAFLNQSEDFGETVVNCALKLKELGITTGISRDGLRIAKHGSELVRLFSELGRYEQYKNYYPDGDAYVTQIKQSVANEINEINKIAQSELPF